MRRKSITKTEEYLDSKKYKEEIFNTLKKGIDESYGDFYRSVIIPMEAINQYFQYLREQTTFRTKKESIQFQEGYLDTTFPFGKMMGSLITSETFSLITSETFTSDHLSKDDSNDKSEKNRK